MTWGDRAADEGGHFRIGVTDLNQEQYERLVREREAVTDGASGDASTGPGAD